MASTLPSLKGSIRTHNETSFAIGFGDANSLILDALAVTGSTRKTLLKFAMGRAETALSYAATQEELTVVEGLINTLHSFAARGLDV